MIQIALRLISIAVAITVFTSAPVSAGRLREKLQERASGAARKTGGAESITLGGVQTAVWKPVGTNKPAPLVVFSHGFHGRNTQTIFLMKAMADAGYLVVAPNHADAISMGNTLNRPQAEFGQPKKWSDATYADRRKDIDKVLAALKADPAWNAAIDWDRIALAGHSLGGYTVLGLAGAWPSWKLKNIKAVLALSPYTQPFIKNPNLAGIVVPVMYQTGTRDMGILPALKRKDGAYFNTPSPAYFVNFDKMGHFAWSNFNRDKSSQDLIDYYSIAFLDKYVKGSQKAEPERKLPGVVDLLTR